MKKRVLSMLMVMIMMVSMLSVSVFAATDHTGHTLATEWSKNATAHWHVCQDAGCVGLAEAEQANYGTHTFVNGVCDPCGYECQHVWDNGVCTICSYACQHDWIDNGTKAICGTCYVEHTHTLSSYEKDKTNHWQVCSGCVVSDVKYNEAAHTFEKDTAASTATKIVYKCVCGAEKVEHEHEWATKWTTSDSKHWYECTDSSCSEKKDEAAHKMVQDGTEKKCSVCGYSEHVCVWSKKISKDSTYHWYECVDKCGEVKGKEMHYDHNSTGTCDVCDAYIAEKTMTTLTITGLTEPTEGAAVDFTASVAEDRFGSPDIKWNRVVNLSANSSVALGKDNTYAAGTMYNTSILVPMNSQDVISDDIKITLNGVVVPYYTTDAAYQNAIKSFEGRYTVYAAKAMWTNSYLCICVSVQYPATAGTHSHDFGNGWLATPAKHYLKCVGCGEVPEAEYHYDVDKSGFCDVCDYNMNYYNPNAPTYADGTTAGTTGTAGTHTHTYSTDWVEDISNHWKQCTGCGAKTQVAAHADLNNTGKCDVCGFVMTAAAGHTHTFATEWTETFAQHYKVCSCGAKNEIAAHVDLNNTGKCDTCGYAMTTLSNNGIVADTGDDNATFLWMAAFAVSVLGLGATVLFARKKREE